LETKNFFKRSRLKYFMKKSIKIIIILISLVVIGGALFILGNGIQNTSLEKFQIMTYGKHIIYLKAYNSELPHIPLSRFNYTSGTFEKKWGPEHKTIVLTPNHSSIRKVEIEIQGIDIHNMKLLPDKTGDVIEDTAKIKITRHYRFEEGDSENKKDSKSASPGKKGVSKN